MNPLGSLQVMSFHSPVLLQKHDYNAAGFLFKALVDF